MRTGWFPSVMLLAGIAAGHPGTAAGVPEPAAGLVARCGTAEDPLFSTGVGSFADGLFHQGQGPDLSSAEDGGRFSPPGSQDGDRLDGAWSRVPDRDHRLSGPGHQDLDSILAMDTSTGELLWVLTGSGFDYGSLMERDGRLYFYADECLVCVDLLTGRVIWTFGNGSGTREGSGVRTCAPSASRYYPEGPVSAVFGLMEEGGTVLLFPGSTSTTIGPDAGASIWRANTDDENDAGPISYISTDLPLPVE